MFYLVVGFADIVRNVTLLSATGIAGALWAVVIISSFGTYRRTSDSLWAHCDIEILLLWVSVGMLSNAGFLRVYRHWKLLYVKDRRMWSTEVCVLVFVCVSDPCLISSQNAVCEALPSTK